MTTLSHFMSNSGLAGFFLFTFRLTTLKESSSELEEVSAAGLFGTIAPCSEAKVWKVVMTTSYF